MHAQKFLNKHFLAHVVASKDNSEAHTSFQCRVEQALTDGSVRPATLTLIGVKPSIVSSVSLPPPLNIIFLLHTQQRPAMGRVKVNSVRTVGGVAVKKAGGKPGSKPGQEGDGENR